MTRSRLFCFPVNAADLLGIADQVGSRGPGKSADLIAVQGDPLADIDQVPAYLQSLRIDTSQRTLREKVKTVMVVDPRDWRASLA
jgi:imidazolonepropionase-like amidohydrolase